ncbi:MAG: ATP-dependent Clp protease proteolytic subunit [Rhodoferax sp.]|nr:ATP-dependent Clp protease proteolytic subunit [Rhodoferax sp.]MCF8209538.1 ATP-dependent Clp protease proteolytic subunit [Rhodoferax sp.]
MRTDQSLSITCEHMGPHEAVVLYSGAICEAGALALQSRFQSLFGYYQYNRVQLQLESPGGSVEAMHFILRQMQRYEQQGRAIAISTTFLCASAAAVMLAMGSWGERKVDRSTTLLFHTVRIESGLNAITAALSSSLSQSLQSVDRHLVDLLVKRMVMQTGSEEALAHLVVERCQYVERNWNKLAVQLGSLQSDSEGTRKPQWLKLMIKFARHGISAGKFTNELKKHLHSCMQREVRMDVRQAYALLLIDTVDGVIDADALRPEDLEAPSIGLTSNLPTAGALLATGATLQLDMRVSVKDMAHTQPFTRLAKSTPNFMEAVA